MHQEDLKAKMANELAKERNRAASDRTLMAYIRTAISLMGFGFAIAKSFDYVEAEYLEQTGMPLDVSHTPMIFGIGFLVIGMLAALGGVIQYHRTLKQIRSNQFLYQEPMPLPKIIAILLLIMGAFGMLAIFL